MHRRYVPNQTGIAILRIAALLKRIELNTTSLIEICDAAGGIKEYQTGKGKPKQTPKERENKVFNSPSQIDDSWRKHITGKNLHHYIINWESGF